MTSLQKKYREEAVPALFKEFDYPNLMAVPRIVKISVNVGLGEAIQNGKLLDQVGEEVAMITGQKPVIRRARKSIAGFKLREGMPIGLTVTLRGERMFNFLERLLKIGLPRVRDFRGVSPRAFDGRGNYTLGLKDQLIFPEIDLGKTERLTGMNVTIVTTAETDEEGRFLLQCMGMPFATREERRLVSF